MALVKKLQKVLSSSRSLNIFDKAAVAAMKNLKEYSFMKESTITCLDALNIDEEKDHQLDTILDISGSNLKCTTCKVGFSNLDSMKDHFKLDWHRFNTKQKLLIKPPITEEDFYQQISGELSSISGSDSESDEDMAPTTQTTEVDDIVEKNKKSFTPGEFFSNHPYKRFFLNEQSQLLSLYRNVSDMGVTDHNTEIGKDVWIYLMLSAGHFAGVVYEKKSMITHKTFHRYTIRAKRGTSQGIHDKKQGGAKSAGASIRRYNEAALTQEIQELIQSWKSHFNNAERIFYRCAPHNFHVLFDQKEILSKDDSRCTKISINTRRPTLKEVKRIHELFSTIEIYGSVLEIENTIESLLPQTNIVEGDAVQQEITTSSKLHDETTEALITEEKSLGNKSKKGKKKEQEVKTKKGNKKVDLVNKKEEEETEISRLWKLLHRWCENKEVEKLQTFLHNSTKRLNSTEMTSENIERWNTSFEVLLNLDEHINNTMLKEFYDNDSLNYCSCEKGETVLHTASRCSSKELVTLLMSHGCNPAIRDTAGRKPYDVASDKDVRNEFRRFMAKYPEQYDYKSANIPSALTEEQEIEQEQKNAEKKKVQNKARKDRQKVKKAEERQQKLAEKEQKAFESLSDREKRAAMAERRFASQLTASLRCSNCRLPINEKDAFERFEYKYCSTSCVQAHKLVIGK